MKTLKVNWYNEQDKIEALWVDLSSMNNELSKSIQDLYNHSYLNVSDPNRVEALKLWLKKGHINYDIS